jgi:putative copper resistance protein D
MVCVVGPRRDTRRIAWVALGAAAALTSLWAALETAAIAGSVGELGVVLLHTLFGQLVLLRLGLLGAAGLALGFGWIRVAAGLSALAVVSIAGHGHAMAMYDGPSWLLLSEVVHLLAAGAWLGGLVPLAAFVASSPADAAALASRRFASLGTACVAAIAGSALFQGTELVGGVPELLGTAYGLVVLGKLTLFIALVGLAARHRFRLTPALGARPAAKRALAGSIGVEAVIGLVTVLAAGLLASLPPAMHMHAG